MINTLKHGVLLVTAIFMVATPATSQAPTDAQRNAIRSQCRADYQAHCASVPPGGQASLQCLQKNMSSLSSGCQGAVRAVEPAAAPKAEAAPAAPAAAAAPAASPKASAASTAAPAAAPAATAAKPAAAAPTAAPKAAASPAAPVAATAGPGAIPAAAPGPALVLRPMRPREELFVLRSACSGDVRTLCGGVAPGGGRIMQCLATRAGSVSPACKEVLAQFAAN